MYRSIDKLSKMSGALLHADLDRKNRKLSEDLVYKLVLYWSYCFMKWMNLLILIWSLWCSESVTVSHAGPEMGWQGKVQVWFGKSRSLLHLWLAVMWLIYRLINVLRSFVPKIQILHVLFRGRIWASVYFSPLFQQARWVGSARLKRNTSI